MILTEASTLAGGHHCSLRIGAADCDGDALRIIAPSDLRSQIVSFLEGSVALFDRRPRRGATWGLGWLDGGSDFVECSCQPEQLRRVDRELVVARRRFWI
jgi:hypothetical protein